MEWLEKTQAGGEYPSPPDLKVELPLTAGLALMKRAAVPPEVECYRLLVQQLAVFLRREAADLRRSVAQAPVRPEPPGQLRLQLHTAAV